MSISVIIPTYNRAHTLKRAVTSVAKQTYKNIKLYIVDDGSTDNSKQVVNELKQEFPYLIINYTKKINGGVSSARNEGINQATTEWIAFLDSDDEWLPRKLELQLELASKQPDLKLIHGNEKWIRNGKHQNQKNIHKKSGGEVFINSTKLCLISPSATLIKKELLTEMDNFNEEFTVCEDYDLWLKITAKYEIGFVEEPVLIKYGGHSDQLSTKFFAMDYWRIKSLFNLIRNNYLRKDYKEVTIKTILEKARILLKGYEKHNNLEYVSEIEAIVKEIKTL